PNFGEPGGSRVLTPSRQTSNIVAIAPPDIAQPGWGEPGGSRGSVLGGVERIDRTLVALVDDGPALAVYPTLFIYLPDLVEAVTSVYGPLKITITLLDSQGTVVHEASRLTPDTAGILGIPLADLEGLAPLLSNQVYEWQLQIASLDPNLVLEGAILMGRIEQLDGSAVEFPVNTMTVPEDYSTYGDAGIWYDAVAILFSQWQVTPDDPVLASALQELLLSVGLEDRISPHSFIGYWSDLEEIDNATIDEDEESQTGHSNSSNGMGSTFIPPSVELIPMGSPGGTR
ncbi:MAG: DUF928 domain-containing protein, partial [Leptolyngbyaceae bacterium]|nr:DUF928 domain-containing protein [Leptolyngbyaceae bacterium]